MTRVSAPTKSTRVYLARQKELHKQLRKEIRDARKAEREKASQ